LMPARAMASLMTMAPSSVEGIPLRLPPKSPIGVLQALTMTTSRMLFSFPENERFLSIEIYSDPSF
jgi:hypothetical protein